MQENVNRAWYTDESKALIAHMLKQMVCTGPRYILREETRYTGRMYSIT
jgi:hypothetical protein